MGVSPEIEPEEAAFPEIRHEVLPPGEISIEEIEYGNIPDPEALPEPDPAPVRPVVKLAPVPARESGKPEKLPLDDLAEETPEESTLAAREIGLVAVREMADTAGHNRWAAGTLAGGIGGLEEEPARRVLWPFVLFAILLLLILLGQLAYHYRGEVVRKMPGTRSYYEMLSVDVPLPRNVDLVAIETSDLQSDNLRGLFVLQATLRNRAAYAQAWPDLELTLTDARDTVVSRRVLAPRDYLPPGVSPQAFPANGETGVRLWIDASDTGAAGYRLYVFYP